MFVFQTRVRKSSPVEGSRLSITRGASANQNVTNDIWRKSPKSDVRWGCSSVGRAPDRHSADAGSIPRYGKGFISEGQLLVQALLRCPYTPPCAIACISICVHVRDPVVHVSLRWIIRTLTHPTCTVGLVARPAAGFPGESNPNFPVGKIQL